MSSRKTCEKCGTQAYADRWDTLCPACKPERKR